MTAILIFIAVGLLLALTGGEQGDFWNTKAGQPPAPSGARFGAGLIVVIVIAAICLFGLLWEAPAP